MQQCSFWVLSTGKQHLQNFLNTVLQHCIRNNSKGRILSVYGAKEILQQQAIHDVVEFLNYFWMMLHHKNKKNCFLWNKHDKPSKAIWKQFIGTVTHSIPGMDIVIMK